MRSLIESIFDINSEVYFGDLFKFESVKVSDKPATNVYGEIIFGGKWTLDNLYNYRLIAKDSGVKGSNPKDVVVNGLVKLIENIPVKENTTNATLDAVLREFNKYYKSIVFNTRRLRAVSLPCAFRGNGDVKWEGDVESYTAKLNSWTLKDVKSIKITFCRIEFSFVKK